MFRFGLSSDGNTFTAVKFTGFGEGQKELPPLEPTQRIAVLCDVETTGVSSQDEVIEIGARKIVYEREYGEVVFIGPAFEGLQQPSKPLTPFITELTGLTDERLAGQSIDWDAFNTFIEDAAVLIAHNCAFDRPFIDRKSTMSRTKIWACSSFHLDWRSSFPSGSQPLLALFHGFFYDGHRALIDVDALVKILSIKVDDEAQTTYLHELLRNAKEPCYRVYAANSPYESKDVLKRRRYRWDPKNRVWSKIVRGDLLESEKTFLAAEVYDGEFQGTVECLALRDNFRAGW